MSEKCDCLVGFATISYYQWADEEDFRDGFISKSVMESPCGIYIHEWCKKFNYCPMCGRKLEGGS